jgi:hypothetical protein
MHLPSAAAVVETPAPPPLTPVRLFPGASALNGPGRTA